jgi:DNA modification methylase
MQELKINKEFQALIPALSPDEYAGLEKSIKETGFNADLGKIIVWNDTIVDGHNRYNICQDNNIPFETKELIFETEQDALIWIIKNQLGRRNLTDYNKTNLALQLTDILSDKAKENQKINGKNRADINNSKDSLQSFQISENSVITNSKNNNNDNEQCFQISENPVIVPINTVKEIGNLAGVSHDTVIKVKNINANAADEIKQELSRPDSKISINTASIISKLPQSEQADILTLSDKEIIKKAKEIKKIEQEKKIKLKLDNIKSKAKDIKAADITILEGDILEKIKEIPDGSVDLLLTDPPYGVMNDYDWDKFQFKETFKSWLTAIFPKLKKEHTGFICMDSRQMFTASAVLQEFTEIKNTIIWIRKNMSNGRMSKNKFISSYEVIFYFGTRPLNFPPEWNGEQFDSLEFAVPQSNFNDKKYHPTQKPLKLFEHLIKVGSYDYDTVLDCFAGAMTTGVACKNIGNRKCILIEKDPEYIQIGKGRIAEADNVE